MLVLGFAQIWLRGKKSTVPMDAQRYAQVVIVLIPATAMKIVVVHPPVNHRGKVVMDRLVLAPIVVQALIVLTILVLGVGGLAVGRRPLAVIQ